MKKLLIVVMMITGMYCTNIGRGTHGADGYHITGSISNNTSQLITLDEISQEGFTTLDSAKVDAKGNFILTGRVKETIFCALRIDPNTQNEKRIFLVLDSNTKVKLDFDLSNIDKYKVKGAKDCELMKELVDLNKKTQEEVRMMEGRYSMYDPNDLPDSISKAARKEYMGIIQKQVDAIDKFVSDNNSITNYFAAMFLLQEPPFELMEKVDEKGFKKFPNSKYAKTMHTYVQSKKTTSKGMVAPDLELLDVNGQKLPLSSLKGQYVLIDFWASWCGPCRRENPNNVLIYKKYHDKGFEIYGVSLDDNKQKWMDAIKADKLEWKHVSDLAGWQSKAAAMYNVSSIPQTFLLDKEGKIIASGLRGEDLENKLKVIFGF